MGCRIGANCTAIFLCADDVILLALSDEALQSPVDIVSNANLPVRVSNPPFCLSARAECTAAGTRLAVISICSARCVVSFACAQPSARR